MRSHPKTCKTKDHAERDELDSRKFIEPMYKDSRAPSVQENASSIPKPTPNDVLKAYEEDEDIKSFADRHVDFRKFSNKAQQISVQAFVLVHAIQILLFAPMDWDSKRVYSRDNEKYIRRFSTPADFGGGTGT
ncbi:hypothetical protein FCOIX_12213 [Fusarium coicis]|nr:hypothetical protein FCOIX_12213 [Fusarium coicis]